MLKLKLSTNPLSTDRRLSMTTLAPTQIGAPFYWMKLDYPKKKNPLSKYVFSPSSLAFFSDVFKNVGIFS